MSNTKKDIVRIEFVVTVEIRTRPVGMGKIIVLPKVREKLPRIKEKDDKERFSGFGFHGYLTDKRFNASW